MSLPPLPLPRCWYRRLASRAVPLSLFRRLYGNEQSAFLYESLEAHGGRGRYSFIGARPYAVFSCRGRALELRSGRQTRRADGDPLEALRGLLRVQADTPPVAPFCGGAVGYLSYDMARWCENIPSENPDDLGVADACFLFPQEVICFDHLEQVMHVLLYQERGQTTRFGEIKAALEAVSECDEPLPSVDAPTQSDVDDEPGRSAPPEPALASNMTQAQFQQIVTRAKEYIYAGDIIQVVPSQRFEFPLTVPPLRLYEALRQTNPSPYMYYLALGDLHVAGSSPELLVKLTGRKVVTRPLAGTRPRGRTPAQDEALARELKADEKERAEHVMLVDLGRNDLGRVCEYGSVNVTETLEIERHSRVMHLVSHVEGWLREDRDALDVFQAVFPAGTVSGAPKVRAMEIIEELEPVRRGIYAGAIGYFSLLGDVDLCIAIRTIVMHRGRGYIQAGAGIVADSVAHREYQETLSKAHALMRAVRIARRKAARPPHSR
jgi:anthranilate synthase component 1